MDNTTSNKCNQLTPMDPRDAASRPSTTVALYAWLVDAECYQQPTIVCRCRHVLYKQQTDRYRCLYHSCHGWRVVAKSSKSRVWKKILEESNLILEILKTRCIMGQGNLNTSSIHAVVSIQYRRVTDRQTDRQTHTQRQLRPALA